MEPIKREKQFNRFISIVYVLSFIPFVLAILAAIAVVVGIIVVITLPMDLVEWIQKVPIGQFSTHLQELGFLSSGLSDDITLNKMPLILLFLTSLVVVIIILCLLFFINRWLKNLKDGQFFDANNSRYIEYAGYSIIVLSLWYGVEELALTYVVADFLESNPEILNILSNGLFEASDLLAYSFSMDIVMLFIGILVWILGRVFKYGTYLQNEYDQTV